MTVAHQLKRAGNLTEDPQQRDKVSGLAAVRYHHDETDDDDTLIAGTQIDAKTKSGCRTGCIIIVIGAVLILALMCSVAVDTNEERPEKAVAPKQVTSKGETFKCEELIWAYETASKNLTNETPLYWLSGWMSDAETTTNRAAWKYNKSDASRALNDCGYHNR